MTDAFLRRALLWMLNRDLRMADDAAGLDENMIEATLLGPDAFADFKRHWYMPMNRRILMEEIAQGSKSEWWERSVVQPMPPLPESECHGFEPPRDEGGLLDCRCTCHQPIGPGWSDTGIHTCVHCNVIR